MKYKTCSICNSLVWEVLDETDKLIECNYFLLDNSILCSHSCLITHISYKQEQLNIDNVN